LLESSWTEESSGFSRSFRAKEEPSRVPVAVLSQDMDLPPKVLRSGLDKLVISFKKGSLGRERVNDHHREAGVEECERKEATSEGRESVA